MKKIFVSVIILLLGLSFSVRAQSITKIYLTLDSASNTGKCPRVLKFKAVLLTDKHPGTVTLKWKNASGSFVRTATVTLTSSGQDVATYNVGIPTKVTDAMSVETTGANPVQSNPVQYTVTCK